MTNADYFNLIAAASAAIAAALWAASAYGKIPTGYDAGSKMSQAFGKAARPNASAAAFAATPALCVALTTASKFVPALSWANQ